MQSVSREESRHNHNKNPSTASTNSRGAGCENKHMDAVQRNKLNIHSVGTEMKSLAANMPNHRVQFSAGVVSASSRSAWECELFEADFQALHIQSFVMWKQFKCSAVASDRIIPDYLMLPRFHCVSIAV